MTTKMEFDEQWLRDYCRRTGTKFPMAGIAGIGFSACGESKRKDSKYGNRKTKANGRVFDSAHEAKAFAEMELAFKAGEIRALMCQVVFLLPGGVRYLADFVTLNNDGTYTVYDAKSDATRKDKVYRIKKRQMRECLGIEIQER